MYRRQQRFYDNNARLRGKLFFPLAKLCTKLHIKPNYITLAGLVFFALSVLYMKSYPGIALFLLVLGIVADAFDGVLSRYQASDSDRGKFIDVIADNLVSIIFVFGVALAGLANGVLVIAYVYLMMISKGFRLFLNSFLYNSDWHFRAVAGLTPNLIVYIGYGVFGLYALTGVNIFLLFFSLSIIVLLLDSAYNFFKILRV